MAAFAYLGHDKMFTLYRMSQSAEREENGRGMDSGNGAKSSNGWNGGESIGGRWIGIELPKMGMK